MTGGILPGLCPLAMATGALLTEGDDTKAVEEVTVEVAGLATGCSCATGGGGTVSAGTESGLSERETEGEDTREGV